MILFQRREGLGTLTEQHEMNTRNVPDNHYLNFMDHHRLRQRYLGSIDHHRCSLGGRASLLRKMSILVIWSELYFQYNAPDQGPAKMLNLNPKVSTEGQL